ncbi:MAG: choice-of-anchor A family protein [Sphingomonadaceae bacterium]
MTTSTLMKRFLPALLGAVFLNAAQAAVTSIDLGPAAGYSAFFYGNVSNVRDVEGKLAVGGNLATDGYSFGYRVPHGVSGPALVVGGDLALGNGAIYGPAPADADTNATLGPITEYTKNGNGSGVYGGTNTSVDYLQWQLSQQSGVINFGAAKTQLTQLSTQLNQLAPKGSVSIDSSGMYLTGDGASDLQVFNVGTGELHNLVLSNVKAGATVIINVSGASSVNFSGGQDGSLQALREHVLFNLSDAEIVNVDTFVWGSVLANKANLIGAGHLEGSIVATSMTGTVEIGYEPLHLTIPAPVPEPETYAMLLAGLGLVGWAARRRRA